MKKRKTAFRLGLTLFFILLAIYYLYPTFYLNSLKTEQEAEIYSIADLTGIPSVDMGRAIAEGRSQDVFDRIDAVEDLSEVNRELALEKARYLGLNFSQPIQFWLSNEELSAIDPSIGELFEDKAVMTVLIYEGPLDKLTEDMAITEITSVITGDLNVDGRVDIYDVGIVAIAFGSKPGDPDWNPIANLNNDSIIDIFDVVTVATNFGKTA